MLYTLKQKKYDLQWTYVYSYKLHVKTLENLIIEETMQMLFLL